MKLAFVSVVLGTALTVMSASASAQFGNLLKPAAAGASISADQIVKRYVGGAKGVMTANAVMLGALGMKTEAGRAAAQAANLTEGATKDVLEESAKVQTENSKALEGKLGQKNATMDAASKKEFVNGVSELASGVKQYVLLGKDVAGFKPGLGSLSASAGTAISVVKTLPESTKNLVTTLKMAIEFCKTNNIPVPAGAVDATAMI